MAVKLRVGIVGLGANCRLRHVPGFRACEDVEILGVCNRSSESTARAAEEFDIPRQYQTWEQLTADPDIDAVLIGTWPYLHCPITVKALSAGKHVLTEARMARNVEEARQMYQASAAHPELVAQIVPSPFGFRAGATVKRLIAEGFLGELRECVVIGTGDGLADPDTEHHWRQSRELSGVNMLSLGILHETLIRWVPHPTSVMAQTRTFVTERMHPETKQPAPVETPDSLAVLSEIEGGATGIYHLSGVTQFGPGSQIHLYGTEGTLKYRLIPDDVLFGARRGDADLLIVQVPAEEVGGWRVEQDFVDSIRNGTSVSLTDFATGVAYMEFTEAVFRSSQDGQRVSVGV